MRTWYGGGGNRSRSIATRNESPTAGLVQPEREPERERPVDPALLASNRISSRRLGQEIVPRGVSHATTDRPKSTVGGSVVRRNTVQAASSPAWSADQVDLVPVADTPLATEDLPPVAARQLSRMVPGADERDGEDATRSAAMRSRRHEGRTRLCTYRQCYRRDRGRPRPPCSGILAAT